MVWCVRCMVCRTNISISGIHLSACTAGRNDREQATIHACEKNALYGGKVNQVS